ncbi:coiled-coil domain-containing protein 174-like [Centruroides vittatus]|uniref:coiled-coil domain-containing protein 174-like n=1 Tax=Centruroides vittatus TaxID=120091 RepID=UPI00350FC0F7
MLNKYLTNTKTCQIGNYSAIKEYQICKAALKVFTNNKKLIDLKAELFKKQEALKAEKLRREFGQPSAEPPKKKSLKQNAGVQERAKKDVEEKPVSQEEIDLLQQSRTVLEKKAKIYESLTDGNVPNDEVKELYLVDFQRKVLDQKKLGKPKEVEKKSISSVKPNTNVNEEKKDVDFDDTSSHSLDKDDSEAPNPDEEWVDYTDSLGRSRRCLRKDLPDLLEMDKQLKKTNKIVPEEDQSVNQESSENISSDLPEVETPAEPVHYQTVQNNEIRSHGVGYYSFSTEEEERKAQLENLNQLREQTVKQRSARDRLKEKRKAILKARLDKVKKRKNIEVEESDESISDEEFDPLKPPVQEEVKEEKPETSPKVRPWDVGKIFNTQKQKYKYTQESWIEKRRTDRIKEFAPPTSYHKNTDNDEKSDQEKSDSPEFTEEVKEDTEEIEDDDKVNENENDSIPLSQATSDSEIERMIAETVTYYRKQTE